MRLYSSYLLIIKLEFLMISLDIFKLEVSEIYESNNNIDFCCTFSFRNSQLISSTWIWFDFSNMEFLDADDEPLYDQNHRKADRDLVQFVPYRNFQNNGQKLAEQVLEEIPRQIVEFYQHKKISPGEPIVNIQSAMP